MSETEQMCRATIDNARTRLVPLLVGGLSAARTSPIGATADRLGETIALGFENSLRRGGGLPRFDDPEDDGFYVR
jgi:hypothetical protein